jgi:uridine phosphorylase
MFQIILGKTVGRPAVVDQSLAKELLEAGSKLQNYFPTVTGKTMCTDDFYEGQGRLDGAICDYTVEDKMAYLRKLSESGVKNIEMEATALAAVTHHAGVRSGNVCVTQVDRLKGDQVVI